MDRRVVKLQIKVFLDGNEEDALVTTSDIFKTQATFGSSFVIPNVDMWVREAARKLLEGQRPITQLDPDPDLLRTIVIMNSDQGSPDVRVNEPEGNNDDDVVVHDHQELTKTDEQSSNTAPETIPQGEMAKDDPLNISVMSSARTDEDDKRQLKVIVRREALDKAETHANKDTSRETGGMMLGRFIENETTITVIFTGIVRALSAVRETSSVKFTPETWADIWRVIDQDKNYSNENMWSIVGWYHTHPGFGVFLSGFDKFIQKEYFTRNGHLALVIDPISKTNGFFVTEKETGEPLNISEQLVTIPKDDKELLKELNEIQTLYKYIELPPSEIALPEGSLQ